MHYLETKDLAKLFRVMYRANKTHHNVKRKIYSVLPENRYFSTIDLDSRFPYYRKWRAAQ